MTTLPTTLDMMYCKNAAQYSRMMTAMLDAQKRAKTYESRERIGREITYLQDCHGASHAAAIELVSQTVQQFVKDHGRYPNAADVRDDVNAIMTMDF